MLFASLVVMLYKLLWVYCTVFLTSLFRVSTLKRWILVHHQRPGYLAQQHVIRLYTATRRRKKKCLQKWNSVSICIASIQYTNTNEIDRLREREREGGGCVCFNRQRKKNGFGGRGKKVNHSYNTQKEQVYRKQHFFGFYFCCLQVEGCIVVPSQCAGQEIASQYFS